MAKRGKYGHPGSAGTAQSGGINHTFGGGKGGTKESRTSTRDRRIGTTSQRGLEVAIRTEVGQSAKTAQKGRVGKPPPVRAGGPKTVTAHINPPARGGSR